MKITALRLKLLESLEGFTPGRIALILALGLVLGIFPVFGVPTLLCAAVAIVFRLNLAAIQIVNQACSPLQYLLLVPLARLGGGIMGGGASRNLAEHVVSGTRNAVVGWCFICLPLGLVLYMILRASINWRVRFSV